MRIGIAKQKRAADPHALGFTLIEVLLVLVLLGLLFTSVLPRVTNIFRVNVQSSVRRFGSIVRYAYDQSILTGRLHRIVLDLDKQSWAVEVASPGELPIDQARRELNPWIKKRTSSSDDDEKDPDEPGFQKAGDNLISPMPDGVAIVSVKSWRLGETPVKAGVVSIYAYPSGLIDEATVNFAEEGQEDRRNYEVTIKALTGRVEIEVENKT